MKKSFKKTLWLGALLFSVSLVGVTYANLLDNLVSGFSDAVNDLLLEPRWHITNEVSMERNSLIYVKGMESAFGTDPLIPTYKTTLRVGDPTKINFSFTHQLKPYAKSRTSTTSSGNEQFSLAFSYPIKPNCFSLNTSCSWSKSKQGPGIDTDNPLLLVRGGGMVAKRRIDGTDRFGVGINLTLPSASKKIFDMRASIGSQGTHHLYPSSEIPVERTEWEKDEAPKANVYADFTSNLRFSPKFKITCKASLKPDQYVGRGWVETGYIEQYSTQKRLEIGSEYELNPALKFGCGYSYFEEIAGKTLGKGAEELSLLGETKTGKDEFCIKVDFRP
jgi:hypothetical protein